MKAQEDRLPPAEEGRLWRRGKHGAVQRRYTVTYQETHPDPGDPSPPIWRCWAASADEATSRFYDSGQCEWCGEGTRVVDVRRTTSRELGCRR